MHDVSFEMVKEDHKKYINAMICIKGVKYEAEAAYKTVLLYFQNKEGENKGKEVINVDDIDDTAEIHVEIVLSDLELSLGW